MKNAERFNALTAKIAAISLMIKNEGFPKASEAFAQAADGEILDILNRAASPAAVVRVVPSGPGAYSQLVDEREKKMARKHKPYKLTAHQEKFFAWNAPITFGSTEIAKLLGISVAHASSWLRANQIKCVTQVDKGVWKRKPAPNYANPGHTAPSAV